MYKRRTQNRKQNKEELLVLTLEERARRYDFCHTFAHRRLLRTPSELREHAFDVSTVPKRRNETNRRRKMRVHELLMELN